VAEARCYIHAVTCISDYKGCGLGIGFIEHLQMVTTTNYSVNANSHTLQFTMACTKSSQSAVSSLVVAW
jgi:hypothetical protein